MEEVVDGEYQLYEARDAAFVRKEFLVSILSLKRWQNSSVMKRLYA